MTAPRFSVALLALGAIALGVAPYLGSPWPGVALVALSLGPWGWEAWLVRRKGEADRMGVLEPMAADAANSAKAAHERIGRMQDEVNSLRNAVSLRGPFGG